MRAGLPDLHTPGELLVLNLNVRGLNAHREAVTHLAESTRADVLVLTETKVATRRHTTVAAVKAALPGYQTYLTAAPPTPELTLRPDRQGLTRPAPKAGVMIAIAHRFSSCCQAGGAAIERPPSSVRPPASRPPLSHL